MEGQNSGVIGYVGNEQRSVWVRRKETGECLGTEGRNRGVFGYGRKEGTEECLRTEGSNKGVFGYGGKEQRVFGNGGKEQRVFGYGRKERISVWVR